MNPVGRRFPLCLQPVADQKDGLGLADDEGLRLVQISMVETVRVTFCEENGNDVVPNTKG